MTCILYRCPFKRAAIPWAPELITFLPENVTVPEESIFEIISETAFLRGGWAHGPLGTHGPLGPHAAHGAHGPFRINSESSF